MSRLCDEALEHLEVQFLANRDPHLQFALLSDFTDAAAATREGDGAILDAAVHGIETLNARYPSPPGQGDSFFLFHRHRLWNPRQGVWMGWERKRGKLAQFNRYLRGGARDAFSVISGDTRRLPDVRYVITLDSDTVLPRGTAATLVGAIAHPLNRAIYDSASGRVVAGYGILQPRIGITLTSANRSRFAAIYSGHPGVDPYTIAVSDVYQDLFGEGSYTGKGIYDVDAFELATHGRFPENTLLSHDLIEGAYSRAALATDVEMYDDFPTRYLTFTRRKHRWIRGDWQLLRWLGASVPGPDGPEPNRLSAISRWKIFDNLRRSVVEIAQLLLLICGWLVLPGTPAVWSVLVLAGIASPWAFSLALSLLRPPGDKSWRAYYRSIGRDAVTGLQQVGLAIVFLPHQAVVSGDAIARTLWRLFVSHRHLLEWQTASQVERVVGKGSPREVWRRMWPAVAIAGIAALAVVARLLRTRGLDPAVSWTAGHQVLFLVATLPLIVLWIVSPSIANALSAPAVRRERQLSASERWTALRYALLHWRYFDRFVSADTQWLAPDNFQDDPTPVIAPRTSPTNVGLQLLSIVSAYDFGFLPCGTMVDRLEQVFRSLERMERWRGHFYNWYELAELRVLEPAYISTVDSGNLAGHLIALKQACLGIADEPVIDGRLWEALHTALTIAAEELRNAASSGAVDSPRQWQAVLEAAERVRAVLASLPQVAGWPSGAGPGAGPAPLAVPTVASSAASAAGAAAPGTRAFAAGPQGYASPQVIQTLLDRLRTAERVLIERGGAPAPAPPPRVVTGGVAPLVPAGESVPSDVLANEPPTAWLRWSRALLEGHLAEVTATGLRDAAPAATDGAAPATRGCPACRPGVKRPTHRSTPRSSSNGWRRSRRAPNPMRTRWTSPSSTTRGGSCSPSDIRLRARPSIPRTTICWPRRRASPASSRLPRTTCRSSTGSDSGAGSRRRPAISR